jgi:glycosyltransferase involved in cell wall biosynthesis
MDIALAHDSFTQLGGAERIAEAVHELYPAAPIHTLVLDRKLLPQLSGWDIRPTWLQKIYSLYPHFQRLFPLIPVVLATTKAIEADIFISSSSSYAKGFRKRAKTIHINYCHTPTRFLWVDPQHAYNEIASLLKPLARAYFWFLKQWDKHAADQVDYFIANSQEVKKRIQQAYGRTSEIIYPFVDTGFWHSSRDKQGYFLIAGRLQRAKNLEVVIKVFNNLKLPLHVVGSGRHENYLRSIAGPTITFLGRLSDAGLRNEYSGAQALIYPQLEDFGIMPLEAAACGTPTIGLARGGSLETVIPGVTGELLSEVAEASLGVAVQQWDSGKYHTEAMQQHAAKFSKEVFQAKIQEFVDGIKERSNT